MSKFFNFTMAEGSMIYDAFQYPAGELQVRLRPEALKLAEGATSIRITAHLKSGDDLIRLALAKSAVDGLSGARNTLVLPYLPYARADRRFVAGDCMGIQTFGRLLNALHFDSVLTLDAHSAEAGEHISNLVDVSPMPLIERAIYKFAEGESGITVLFPDEGAAERYALPDRIGNNAGGVIIQTLNCKKKRDAATGKLSGFTVPAKKQFAWSKALIVDDICDGGGTFVGIADALGGHTNLGLYASHGIFSRGFADLRRCFSRIYSTDSTNQQWAFEDVHTFPSGLAFAGVR